MTAWLALHAEVQREFAQDSAWDAVEGAAWFAVTVLARAEERQRYALDGWKRFSSKVRRREWRAVQRTQVVGIRCCPWCRRMYPVTAYNRTMKQDHACSPKCRWLVRNRKGKRAVRALTHNGITDTIKGWAQRLGLTWGAVAYRLDVLRLPLDKALQPGKYPAGRAAWKSRVAA